MKLLVKKLHPDAYTPTIAHPGEDLGFDLYALEDTFLRPGQQQIVKTGIAAKYVEAPSLIPFAETQNPGAIGYSGGWYAHSKKFGLKIFDRSGMAAKNGLLTMAGVIDAGYDGEIGVVMILLGPGLHVTPETLPFYTENHPYKAQMDRINAQPWTPDFVSSLPEPDRDIIKWFRENRQSGYQIRRGDKIAQMVPFPVFEGAVEVVDELPKGRRGESGYGSTGR